MKWVSLFSIFLGLFLLVKLEWKGLELKREKVAFLSMLGVASILSVIAIFFPDLPGPSTFIDTMFQPLSQIFEKKDY